VGTTRTIRIVGVLAGLAAVAIAALAGPALTDQPAPRKGQQRFEVRFLTETVDHHFAGVRMGELCVETATVDRLRDVCSEIVTGQSEEIQELRSFLRGWYESDKQPELSRKDQRDLAHLQSLDGPAFDVAVSQMFIEHHGIQVKRSTRCLKRAFHEELRDICARQIELQSAEIEQFERILASLDGHDQRSREDDHHDGDGDRDRHHGGGHHVHHGRPHHGRRR
jgi:uncharacterized protein (DUF305 family)